LDEAVSVRVSKDILNNPKTQALVIANLGNEIYNDYGIALGLPSSTIANMVGTDMNMSRMNGTSGSVSVNLNNPQIKNATAYESAQSLASLLSPATDISQRFQAHIAGQRNSFYWGFISIS
jgi:hypothetical protein